MTNRPSVRSAVMTPVGGRGACGEGEATGTLEVAKPLAIPIIKANQHRPMTAAILATLPAEAGTEKPERILVNGHCGSDAAGR
jgi:hypothetical protein